MPQTVKCPKCAFEFSVEDVIGQQLKIEYEQKLNQELAKIESENKKKETEMSVREQALKKQEENVEKQVAERAKAETLRQQKELEKKVAERVKSDYEVQLQSEKERAADAEKRLQEFKKTQLENERLKRQLESQKQDIELEFEKKLAANEEEQRKKFSERLKAESEIISKREAERQEEQVQQLKKQLDDQKKLADEMRRKAEQGSQQLQGEIQELAIEQFLKTAFPIDQINEIKKGKNGADVVQIVRNVIGKDAGIILYESKNAQSFGGDWIEKLKAEAAESKADVLVLITKAMPKGKEYTELIDGVWVCPYREFQGTARVLREGLLRVSDAYASQDNKEGKAQQLYNYLTSPKFADQMQRVLTNFSEIKDGYEKEKTAMQKVWKKRDAQLDTIIKNLSESFTPIQVIAGSEIPLLGSPENELELLANEE
jgi:hypothetical protein